jgi:hypothetical protein
MIWSRLTTTASCSRFADMMAAGQFTPAELTPEYRRLRELLIQALPPLGTNSDESVGGYDTATGLRLYHALQAEGFTVRAAADDGVWRHLSLCVLPDLVEKRWPQTPEERFWRSRSRIWLRTVWWLTHLAWQGSEPATRTALNGVTTDMVVQLIERPGRCGFRVDLARALFSERSAHKLGQDDFRAMMKLNTARLMVLTPEFTEGGISGYVNRLRTAVVRNAKDRPSTLRESKTYESA